MAGLDQWSGPRFEGWGSRSVASEGDEDGVLIYLVSEEAGDCEAVTPREVVPESKVWPGKILGFVAAVRLAIDQAIERASANG